MKYTIIIVLLVFCSALVFSQGDKYRLAESYEKSGDLKNASRIYYELYEENTRDDDYFKAVVRTYNAMNRFGELKDIIEKRLESIKSPEMYTLYGELLWKSGDNQNANQAWENALTKFHPSYESFSMVAESQSRLRLVDKAIATLKRARKELEDPTAFSNELSQLYIVQGNYQDGTEEILNFFYEHKQLAYTQGRLYALMINEKASDYIMNRIKQEADKQNNNIMVQELYSFFLRAVNNFEEALKIIVRIDDLRKSAGRDILYFADRSRQDEQFQIALKAYSILIDQGKSNRYFTSALYGYAKTLERQLLTQQNIEKGEVEKIIKRYGSIVDEYPDLPEAANSMYQIALLQHEYLAKSNDAIKELNQLIRKFPNLIVTASALNLLGDIYLYQDNFSDSEKAFSTVKNRFNKANSNTQYDYALFKLAELMYFQGNIDSAKTLFMDLSTKSGSDAANDALEKIVIIEKNKTLTAALKSFAMAELKEFQKKYPESIDLYKDSYDKSQGEDLAEQCLIRAAKIEFRIARYADAVTTANLLISKNPDSIYGDAAYLLTGNSYMMEGKKADAIESFKSILTKYPNSIYLQEARKKIRILRDDKLQ